MKKFLNLKAFAIGSTFLLLISGVGSWLFGMPFWQALLIGFACMLVLGFIAELEDGSPKQPTDKGSGGP